MDANGYDSEEISHEQREPPPANPSGGDDDGDDDNSSNGSNGGDPNGGKNPRSEATRKPKRPKLKDFKCTPFSGK